MVGDDSQLGLGQTLEAAWSEWMDQRLQEVEENSMPPQLDIHDQRPDIEEIRNPIDNDRRKLNEEE